jgi:hypothetical protein
MRPAGRSFLITGAVLIVAVALVLQPSGEHRPGPAVSRTLAPASLPPRPVLARDLLASGLTLRAAQRHELEDLAGQWQRESAPLETAVGAASAEFDRFVASAQTAGRTSVTDLLQHSAELRELSAELRARRQVQSDSALAVLTDAQRRQVQTTSGGMR